MFLVPCFMWEETRVHFVSFSKTAVKQLVFIPFCGDCSTRWRLMSYTYLRKGLFLVNSFLFASTWFIFLPDPTWTWCYCVCLLIFSMKCMKNFMWTTTSQPKCVFVCFFVCLFVCFNVKGRKCDSRFSDGRKYYFSVNDLKLCII